MKYKSYDHMNCSLAQTLNIVGERWTLLILRDAFFGALLIGDAVIGGGDPAGRRARVLEFLTEAIASCRALLIDS